MHKDKFKSFQVGNGKFILRSEALQWLGNAFREMYDIEKLKDDNVLEETKERKFKEWMEGNL